MTFALLDGATKAGGLDCEEKTVTQRKKTSNVHVSADIPTWVAYRVV